jgi:hypothetical protein
MTAMKRPDYDTATINEEEHCSDCGWPIIHVCCNGTFTEFSGSTDYWIYCSNKACKNHNGEGGGFQDYPEWAITEE